MLHLKLSFVYGIRWKSRLFGLFFHVVFQNQLERFLFPQLNYFGTWFGSTSGLFILFHFIDLPLCPIHIDFIATLYSIVKSR